MTLELENDPPELSKLPLSTLLSIDIVQDRILSNMILSNMIILIINN